MGNADRGISLNTLAWIATGLGTASVIIGLILWASTPNVYVTNGLSQVMLLRVDGQTLTVPPEDWKEVEGVSTQSTLAEFSLDKGKSWERIELDLSRGARAVVINPYGAAWVYTQGIVYSENSDMDSPDAEHHCGEQVLRLERAHYRFEPTPDTVELSSGKRYTTKWVVDMAGNAEDCLYDLQQDGDLKAAERLMERLLDPNSEDMVFELAGIKRRALQDAEYLSWLERSAAEHQTLPFKELYTGFLMQTPAAEDTLARLEAQLEADPGATEAAYLYSLCVRNEQALPVLHAALETEPANMPINRRLATIYEEQGRLDLAIEYIPQLYPHPEIGIASRHWAAKTNMRLGRTAMAEAILMDSAFNHWPSALALGRLHGELDNSSLPRWRAQKLLPWLRVYTGEHIAEGADPALRLAGLVINGPTDQLMASPLARDLQLVHTLEDHELMLLHLVAKREAQQDILVATRAALNERPVVAQGLEDPFGVPASDFSELSVATACMGKIWSGELSEEEVADMVVNVNHFDPFGQVSAPAGWLDEAIESEQAPPADVSN
jgi:tetratricopeptide (TPR) repeat protein